MTANNLELLSPASGRGQNENAKQPENTELTLLIATIGEIAVENAGFYYNMLTVKCNFYL